MAAKREQVVWKNLWDVAASLERKYGLTAVCSAGILVLSHMSAEEREEAIEAANLYPQTAADVVAVAEAESAAKKQNRPRRQPKSAG